MHKINSFFDYTFQSVLGYLDPGHPPLSDFTPPKTFPPQTPSPPPPPQHNFCFLSRAFTPLMYSLPPSPGLFAPLTDEQILYTDLSLSNMGFGAILFFFTLIISLSLSIIYLSPGISDFRENANSLKKKLIIC